MLKLMGKKIFTILHSKILFNMKILSLRPSPRDELWHGYSTRVCFVIENILKFLVPRYLQII